MHLLPCIPVCRSLFCPGPGVDTRDSVYIPELEASGSALSVLITLDLVRLMHLFQGLDTHGRQTIGTPESQEGCLCPAHAHPCL